MNGLILGTTWMKGGVCKGVMAWDGYDVGKVGWSTTVGYNS